MLYSQWPLLFLHGREISSPYQTNQLQQTLSCTVESLVKAMLGIAAAAYEQGGTCQWYMSRGYMPRGRGDMSMLHVQGEGGGRGECGWGCSNNDCSLCYHIMIQSIKKLFILLYLNLFRPFFYKIIFILDRLFFVLEQLCSIIFILERLFFILACVFFYICTNYLLVARVWKQLVSRSQKACWAMYFHPCFV